MSALASAPAVVSYAYPTLSLLTVALLGYIARAAGKYLKSHNEQHDHLMSVTEKQGRQIDLNTKAIRRMLEQRERIIAVQERKRR